MFAVDVNNFMLKSLYRILFAILEIFELEIYLICDENISTEIKIINIDL